MIAELVAYAKDRGQSLFDMLMEIAITVSWLRFGAYIRVS
jgi:hypothetical protein